MADNRKYYYLKLKENFFDSDSIVLLEDMKDGYKPDQAVDFLQEAANCGNEFAKEQLGYE